MVFKIYWESKKQLMQLVYVNKILKKWIFIMLISSLWSAGYAYIKVQKNSLSIMTSLEYLPGDRKAGKYISLQGNKQL